MRNTEEISYPQPQPQVPSDHSFFLKSFYQNLGLNRLDGAYSLATQLGRSHQAGSRKIWEVLGLHALQNMDVVAARKAYQQLGAQPGMIKSLQDLVGMESRVLLSGEFPSTFSVLRLHRAGTYFAFGRPAHTQATFTSS